MESNDCSCNDCVAACLHKPGWFLPDEVAEAAKFLGMSAQDFFDKYLLVDYYLGDDNNHIYLLSPAVRGTEPGEMFPFNPQGQCVFFASGKCTIHAVKPFECRAYVHTDGRQTVDVRHREIAMTWKDRQEVVTALYEDPQPAEPKSFAEMIGIFLP